MSWKGVTVIVSAALLMISVGLACPLVSYGQNAEPTDDTRLAFGVALGGNLISLAYDQPWTEWDPGRRVSYYASVSAYYQPFRPLTIESGLRLVQLGNEVQVDYPEIENQPSGDGYFQIRQWYVSVPLLPHVTLPLGQSQQVSLFTGPEIGYLVKAQGVTRFDTSELGEPANETTNITDDLRRFNVTLQVGMQYQFPIQSRDVFLRGSYGWGVVDTATTEKWVTAWQTREIAVGAGVMF